jgi:ribosomal-protein-alanine N-acetyltransferase
VNTSASRVLVRRLIATDIGAVLAIQALSPEASQWSRDGYARAAAGEFPAWVAELHGRLGGFLVLGTAADEAEILNLAVDPGIRRCGLATALLEAALRASRAVGAVRLFLEARESNARAIEFYEQQGFRVGGRRPRYYANPLEDALILARSL